MSEQNLLEDDSGVPVNHPDVPRYFSGMEGCCYKLKADIAH